MQQKSYSTTTSFFDVLFNSLIAITSMFVVVFFLINEEQKAASNIVPKAEFIITVIWPPDLDDDVDTYVEDPLENLVFFRSRNVGFMSLERDDIGFANDYIDTLGGRIEFKSNMETVTIRNIVGGEYTCNVHMYKHRSEKPVLVEVKLEKINPYSIILLKNICLFHNGDEKTAFRFVLDSAGNVISTSDLAKNLVKP